MHNYTHIWNLTDVGHKKVILRDSSYALPLESPNSDVGDPRRHGQENQVAQEAQVGH